MLCDSDCELGCFDRFFSFFTFFLSLTKMSSYRVTVFVFVLCFVPVVGSKWDTCYRSCKCADDGSVVICSNQGLVAVPPFGRLSARKIETLGLQRNQIVHLDGARVADTLPALLTLDLRDQQDIGCVELSSPLPVRVKVLGKLGSFFSLYF